MGKQDQVIVVLHSPGRKRKTTPSASCPARGRTPPWSKLPFPKTPTFMPANTSSICPAKRNCNKSLWNGWESRTGRMTKVHRSPPNWSKRRRFSPADRSGPLASYRSEEELQQKLVEWLGEQDGQDD